jgi:hypothetical protein
MQRQTFCLRPTTRLAVFDPVLASAFTPELVRMTDD